MLSVSLFVCVFSTCNMRARHKWHSCMICMSRCTGLAMNPAHSFFSLFHFRTRLRCNWWNFLVLKEYFHICICADAFGIWMDACIFQWLLYAFGSGALFLSCKAISKYWHEVKVFIKAMEIRFCEIWFLANRMFLLHWTKCRSPLLDLYWIQHKTNFNRSPSDVFGPPRYYELTYCVHNLLSAAKLISFGSCFQRFPFRLAHILDSTWHTHIVSLPWQTICVYSWHSIFVKYDDSNSEHFNIETFIGIDTNLYCQYFWHVLVRRYY